MMHVDPLETAEASGAGKKPKGEDEDEAVVPVLANAPKEEAVDTSPHHRLEE